MSLLGAAIAVLAGIVLALEGFAALHAPMDFGTIAPFRALGRIVVWMAAGLVATLVLPLAWLGTGFASAVVLHLAVYRLGPAIIRARARDNVPWFED